ncbi:MAG TPA: hypothetical protein VIL86_20635 [Tepidisphaeraceae bacterium]|jgi:hypothetical protein
MTASSAPNRRRLWIIVGLVAIIVIAVGIWRHDWWRESQGFVGKGIDDATQQEIERQGWIKLPKSATHVQSRIEGFQDKLALLRFELPRADVEGFIENSLSISTQEFPPNLRTSVGFVSWWQPQEATQPEFYQGQRGSVRQWIIIDKTDPKHPIIYVTTMEQ